VIKLNDLNDEVYDKYRFKHLQEGLEKVPEDFKNLVE
jgi:hypothetical protein